MALVPWADALARRWFPMKPTLNHPQAVWLGAGLLVLGGAVVLAFFGLSGLGERQAEAQALKDRMGNPALRALLSDEAGLGKVTRDIAEIQKLEGELQKEVGALPARWAGATREATGEGQPWAQDPGKWKDQLISVVSYLQKAALEAHVKMSSDFYLGLDSFRQKSPSPSEVPTLALHLAVARRLVEKLFEARKVREQYATPCEIRGLTGAAPFLEKPAESTPGAPSGRSTVPWASPDRKKFRLEILCSPEVLYEYIRLLSSDDWLFLVKDLAVTNQKQEFPPRSEIAKSFSSAATPVSEGREGKKQAVKKLLEILAGDESLVAQLDIEYIAWKNPEVSVPAKPGNTP